MICGKCGRALKTSDSQRIGYGPVCYKNLFGSNRPKGNKSGDQNSNEEFIDYTIPGQMEISDFVSEFLQIG